MKFDSILTCIRHVIRKCVRQARPELGKADSSTVLCIEENTVPQVVCRDGRHAQERKFLGFQIKPPPSSCTGWRLGLPYLDHPQEICWLEFCSGQVVVNYNRNAGRRNDHTRTQRFKFSLSALGSHAFNTCEAITGAYYNFLP